LSLKVARVAIGGGPPESVVGSVVIVEVDEAPVAGVDTFAAFDGTASTTWPHVVHGAPVLATERRAVPAELPWSDEDPTPLVLRSPSPITMS
jgi:hypothetical protein